MCCKILGGFFFFYYGFWRICYTILFELKFSCILASASEKSFFFLTFCSFSHPNLLPTIIVKQKHAVSHTVAHIEQKLVQSSRYILLLSRNKVGAKQLKSFWLKGKKEKQVHKQTWKDNREKAFFSFLYSFFPHPPELAEILYHYFPLINANFSPNPHLYLASSFF